MDPKSAHVSDPFLQKFLSPVFSPADYLNSTLPPLQTSSSSSAPGSGTVPLAELSAQAQDQLTQLNAHTTRLTNTLTQLTDDILRSGSRLAYEVELLRGETLGLSETLTETLHDDVVKFVPEGLREQTTAAKATFSAPATPAVETATPTAAVAAAAEADEQTAKATTITTTSTTNPSFITHLQTLTLIRARLDTVVQTFGTAMEFVFPPSELSVSSSFLSVSAPEPGPSDHSTEEKGQQVLKQLREEIADLLRAGGPDPVSGIEKAARRIEELKDLATVWDGTAEEKGRTKFIDSLAKMVEDRHKEVMREMEQQQVGRRDGGVSGSGRTDGGDSGHKRSGNGSGSLDATAAGESKGLSGYGIMSQLQRLRTGL